MEKKIDCGTYLTGLDHPKQVDFVNAITENGEIVFTRGRREIGRLKIASIKSVVVDDKSTIEKHITATRLLAIGIFALALKKKQKHKEHALVIEHETGAVAFEFTGPGCQIRANAANAGLQRILSGRTL